MHVVIAGCGRVGSQLARELDSAGHGVSVIDKDRRAFRRLGEDFAGEARHGIVFDRGTLEEAGIRQAQAFVAVTSGDNSNIVAARAASEHYGVAHVVARIYDPARATIYERFGITTIASAQWTVDEVKRAIAPPSERVVDSIGPGPSEVVLASFTVPDGVHATPTSVLWASGDFVLAGVTREGRTAVPVDDGLLEAGDQVHVAVRRDALDRVREAVAEMGRDRA